MAKTGFDSEKTPPQKSKGSSRSAAQMEREAATVIMRRAQRKIPDYVLAEELNLVPYLDIITNLVIFLLVTMSVFLPLGMLSIFPLSVSSKSDSSTEEKKPEMNFTVFVTKEGFRLAGTGIEGVTPPIPLLPTGEYDFRGLSDKAVEMKDAHPQETRVILCAENEVKYDTVIMVMDTLREKDDRVLFDDVQLSPGMFRGSAR